MNSYPKLTVFRNTYGFYASLKFNDWKYLYLRKDGTLQHSTGFGEENYGYFTYKELIEVLEQYKYLVKFDSSANDLIDFNYNDIVS